ncbi:MAG: acyl CoA:acetate/3-ketoacid CoA transferase [Opitutus sp.]|nr:acyl CoA:acetate/3-ketoacid CoA transferase [Opitutus sp.]
MPAQILSCDDIAQKIPNGATVAIQGSGGGVAEPTAMIHAIRRRFDRENAPRDLTLIHATGLGDRDTCGTDILAVPGLVKRDIAGHLAMAPKMGKLISDNIVECYNFPQGVISHLYSAIGGRKPGVFTKVGLGTYIDPRLEGGRMNAITKKQLVRVMEIDGEEWLYFPRIKIDVAIIRGTYIDTHGNLSYEEEAVLLEGNAIAQAARACGGFVVAQAKYLVEAGAIPPKSVRVPGIGIDYIAIDPAQSQTSKTYFHPALSGQSRVPMSELAPLPLDERKVVARRAAKELYPRAVVNLGVGMPDGVASVAAETGLHKTLTFTVEQGLVGGVPVGGIEFGVAFNPEACIPEDQQFNFYDGGNLEIAFLGMAQADAEGNVNVSKVGRLLTGCGGFINITQNAKKVVFCGTLNAKGFDCEVGGGRLRVKSEGSIQKFVPKVEQITFNGKLARESGRTILYVTERAVFELQKEGMTLIEIAPGMDLEKDVLAHIGFRPRIASPLKTMDAAFFT